MTWWQVVGFLVAYVLFFGVMAWLVDRWIDRWASRRHEELVYQPPPRYRTKGPPRSKEEK